MYGDRNKKPWDMIPEMRTRSFEHLSALAANVVKNLLGPSPQAADEAERAHFGWAPETPEDLDAWLHRKITERLLLKIDSVLMDLIGIETNYGNGYRLKSGNSSLLGARLMAKAKAMAVEIADKWINEKAGDIVVEFNNESDVRRAFRYELESATKKAIEARMATIAKERAAHVHAEVLEAAVDKAMFDCYPILRRMEAASRLGAKLKDDE